MPLDGQLNRSVAGLSNPGLIGIDLIFNKDIYISALVSWFFLHILYMPLLIHCFDDYKMMILYYMPGSL